jgi:hypothetical protein
MPAQYRHKIDARPTYDRRRSVVGRSQDGDPPVWSTRVVDTPGRPLVPSSPTSPTPWRSSAGPTLPGYGSPRELAFEFAPSRNVVLDMRYVVSMLVGIPRVGHRGSDHAGAGWTPNHGHHAGGHHQVARSRRPGSIHGAADQAQIAGAADAQCCSRSRYGLVQPDLAHRQIRTNRVPRPHAITQRECGRKWLIGFQRGVMVGSRSQLGLPA